MRSHIGLLPQCLFIVRSRAKVNRLEESYVSRAAQRPLWVGSGQSWQLLNARWQPLKYMAFTQCS